MAQRVAVEERADLLFVRDLLLAAAREHGDAAAAAKFVYRVFDVAAPNIAVNGEPYDAAKLAKPVEDFEPLNVELSQKVESLQQAARNIRNRLAKRRVTTAPGFVQTLQAEKSNFESRSQTKHSSNLIHSFFKDSVEELSEDRENLVKDTLTAAIALEVGATTVETTKPQWSRARVIVEDIRSSVDTTTTLDPPPALISRSGTPLKSKPLKQTESGSELTPRKARTGLLKRLQ
ncbi:hypothetical protein BDR26DRAFT_869868 [Obelidium mucronatum]|nr:hypothetical protein BDR26DRAFT_869868 [Obelidium mucronatum]